MAEIDVIMPVHNAEDTLTEATISILEQTHNDFRLLIVDDNSTDNSAKIIDGFAAKHKNVLPITAKNRGIVAALNQALNHTSAKYVARMDADDIALPARFQTQVDYLNENPNVVLLGTRTIHFGDKNGEPNFVISPNNCKRALGLFNPFCHPTIMMRNDILQSNSLRYSAEHEFVEDYELFTRLSEFGDVCNLDTPLLRYRIHQKQISNKKRNLQRHMSVVVARAFINRTQPGRSAITPDATTMLITAFQLGLPMFHESARALRNLLQFHALPGQQ